MVGDQWRLLDFCERAKMRYLGHIVGAGGLVVDVITGMVHGTRKRGRQRTRILDSVVKATGRSLPNLVATARDRGAWRRLIGGHRRSEHGLICNTTTRTRDRAINRRADNCCKNEEEWDQTIQPMKACKVGVLRTLFVLVHQV